MEQWTLIRMAMAKNRGLAELMASGLARRKPGFESGGSIEA